MLHSLFKSDTFERLGGKPVPFLGFHSSVNQRKLNVSLRREARYEVEALENKADFTVSDIAQLVVVHIGNILAVENICSACHNVKQSEHIHQRGFARAGVTDDGNEVALIYAKINAVKRPDLVFARIVYFVCVFQFNKMRHRLPRIQFYCNVF